jgi:hypothetical protein
MAALLRWDLCNNLGQKAFRGARGDASAEPSYSMVEAWIWLATRADGSVGGCTARRPDYSGCASFRVQAGER